MDDGSTKPRIVFFGSGPVAAKSLELLSKYCDVEAVITKPQPEHHKEPFPVLAVAEHIGAQVYTPVGRQALSELFATKPVSSRLGIVIDYGYLINQDVIDYFPLGIINSHFSLLPELRGADPITFSILSGQKETGISLMLITAGMDEGPLLAQTPYAIPPHATTPELTQALIEISDYSLSRIIPLYIDGQTQPADQFEIALPGHERASYSRKLTKEDGLLDFSKPAEQLEREVRAFIEWPKSRTSISGKEIVVTKAHVLEASALDDTGTPPITDGTAPDSTSGTGTIWLDNPAKPKQFGFITSHGVLVVDMLKPAGKPEMGAEAFLAGYGLLLQRS
jgi:methionyl-tRNA formyltransferase